MRRIIVIGFIVFILVAGIISPDAAAARRGGSGRTEAVWSPDGQWLAVVSFIPEKGGVWVYDAADLSAEPRLLIGFDPLDPEPYAVYDVTFSPDSTLIATAAPGQGITLWDMRTWTEISTLDARGSSLAISPDGRLLAATHDAEGAIRFFDMDSSDLLYEVFNTRIGDITFSADSTLLASSGCMGEPPDDPCLRGAIWLWNTANGTLRDILWGDFRWVLDSAFSPDGSTIAFGATDGTVAWRNLVTGEATLLVEPETFSRSTNSVAYSPDGSLLAYGRSSSIVTDDRIAEVVIWDRAAHAKRLTLTHPGVNAGVMFSPDGSRVAAGSTTSGVWIWDAVTGEVIAVLLGPEDQIS